MNGAAQAGGGAEVCWGLRVALEVARAPDGPVPIRLGHRRKACCSLWADL